MTQLNSYLALTNKQDKINYLMNAYTKESSHEYTILVFKYGHHYYFRQYKRVPREVIKLTYNAKDGGDRASFLPTMAWIKKQVKSRKAIRLCSIKHIEHLKKEFNYPNKGYAYEHALHELLGIVYKSNNVDHRTMGSGDLMFNGIEYEIKGVGGNLGKQKYLHK